MERDAQVVHEKVARPSGRVAAHERVGTPRVRRASASANRAEVPSRDHRPYSNQKSNRSPLMRSASPRSGNRVEEALKRGRDRGRDLAGMSVRDDDHTGGGQWHGPQASAVPTIQPNGSGPRAGWRPGLARLRCSGKPVGTALGIVEKGRKRLSHLTFRERAADFAPA